MRLTRWSALLPRRFGRFGIANCIPGSNSRCGRMCLFPSRIVKKLDLAENTRYLRLVSRDAPDVTTRFLCDVTWCYAPVRATWSSAAIALRFRNGSDSLTIRETWVLAPDAFLANHKGNPQDVDSTGSPGSVYTQPEHFTDVHRQRRTAPSGRFGDWL